MPLVNLVGSSGARWDLVEIGESLDFAWFRPSVLLCIDGEYRREVASCSRTLYLQNISHLRECTF